MSLIVHVSNTSGRPESDDWPTDAAQAPPEERVRELCLAALAACEISEGELSVVVTDDPQIQQLNAQWRGKDAPTNVLSFPQTDEVNPSGALGDVVVSIDTVARQGEETGSGYAYTFAFYLVHGILHLLGWDHQNPEDEAKMMKRTASILSEVGVV